MKLIFLHGLPGVGKLTVARELSRLTGFKVFHNHLTVDLVQAVFEFGSPQFVELREKIWLEVFSKAAEAKLDGLIFTFAFEGTVRDGFIRSAQTAVETKGGEVIFVKLRCSKAELEKRMINPTRGAFGKLNSLELFHELEEAGAFVHPEVPEDRLVLDTTNLSATAAASNIVSELRLSGHVRGT